MNLHRVEGHSDWQDIEPSQRNYWQRIAASSYGVLTLANLATFLGLGLVVVGLIALISGSYWLAIILLGGGRLLDIADGWLAEATGTKSQLGEILDAAIDKITTILMLVAMFIANVAAWWLLIALLLPQLASALTTAIKRRQQVKLHSSPAGKLSMAFIWLALVGLVLLKADPDMSSALMFLVYLVAAVSIVLGWVAVIGYAKTRN